LLRSRQWVLYYHTPCMVLLHSISKTVV
jgi:hypothetical protein